MKGIRPVNLLNLTKKVSEAVEKPKCREQPSNKGSHIIVAIETTARAGYNATRNNI